MYAAPQIEAAFAKVLAKARADVVQSWASEQDAAKREALWAEYKAIDRIEETVRNDFSDIIRRESGGE